MTSRAPRPRAALRNWAFLVAFLGVMIFVLLLVGEGALRLLRPSERYFPYHRNSKDLFYPSEEVTPGVSGISRFTTTSYGTRGPELREERVRILTIGGSTTACTVLDDDETWPALLMTDLNADAGDPSFAWVTNSGIDGKNSHHHLMHAKYLLPTLPRIDYVIVYAGLNDVGMWLYREDFDPNYLDKPENWANRVGEAFKVSNFTPAGYPWYKRLELWKTASVAKAVVLTAFHDEPPKDLAFVQDAQLKWMKEAQQMRAERGKEFVHRAKMETLPAALQSYEKTLTTIAELIRQSGAEPIFVGQALQHHFLNEDERRRLWMGAMDGGKKYVDETQMLELVNTHNLSMKGVAERERATYVDLPAVLSGQAELFYDGAHFNEKGAQVVARALADQLGPILRAHDEAERAKPTPGE